MAASYFCIHLDLFHLLFGAFRPFKFSVRRLNQRLPLSLFSVSLSSPSAFPWINWAFMILFYFLHLLISFPSLFCFCLALALTVTCHNVPSRHIHVTHRDYYYNTPPLPLVRCCHTFTRTYFVNPRMSHFYLSFKLDTQWYFKEIFKNKRKKLFISLHERICYPSVLLILGSVISLWHWRVGEVAKLYY